MYVFPAKKKSDSCITMMKDAGNVPGLIRLLADPHYDTQWQAAAALGEMGVTSREFLIRSLQSPEIPVRLGSVEALGMMLDPGAVPGLIHVLETDDCDEVRWAAALALGEIRDARAIRPLVSMISNRNRYIRFGVVLALDKLGWVPENDELKARSFLALQNWNGVWSLGSSAIKPLEEMLSDEDPTIRIKCIRLLSRIYGPGIHPRCRAALCDSREPVRFAAVLASVQCGLAAPRLPLLIARRDRIGPNPAAAAVLNFFFLGIGYNYIGKWWGFLVFMGFMSLIVLAQLELGPIIPYFIAYPVTSLFAIHTYYEAKKMREE